jgi:hypothetical protein
VCIAAANREPTILEGECSEIENCPLSIVFRQPILQDTTGATVPEAN